MTEFFGRQEPGGRDMSRAHWQRSVGHVLMSELTERFFDDYLQPVTEEVIEASERTVARWNRESPCDPVWARAHAVSRELFQVHPGSDLIPDNKDLEAQAGRYTHNLYIEASLSEGLETQTFFPLNLASQVSRVAAKQGIEGFETGSLTEIATVLLRPDFQEVTKDSAFTKNGVWGPFATTQLSDYWPLNSDPNQDITFISGKVAYSSELNRYLKRRMSNVNQEGVSFRANVTFLTSSGCPVRHDRAHFTDSAEDRRNLQILSKYFNKTVNELLAPRAENIIVRGLNVQAGILEQAAAYYDEV